MTSDPKSNLFSAVPCTSPISELSNPNRQPHLHSSDQETLKLNVFKQALIREAEEQAIQLQGDASQSVSHHKQVQLSTSNPKVLYNARGNPYVEADPNMGYAVDETRPRTGNRDIGSHLLVTNSAPSSSTQNLAAAAHHSQPASQLVIQVENEKQQAECDQPRQVSIPNSIEHSTGEELSNFEDELLEVLEGVVSSKQEVEAQNQPKAAVSLVQPHFELETFPNPEPPVLLDPGVKGESAILYSNIDTGFNKQLSKSTKRRLRKQAKEASFSALSSGRN
ncbi:hypothetical protein RHSIM_Rhsim11G0000800 [Rhododendron simsii]|uniref:Uncharacterized protein n=1 Tax=Rhododendron simsii TaxID=118357 RepID=A0A834LAC8_RHOSS|nr:hypothetical protein RHSIM_Rhsim11G0000800 [Rhododendron simsii]